MAIIWNIQLIIAGLQMDQLGVVRCYSFLLVVVWSMAEASGGA